MASIYYCKLFDLGGWTMEQKRSEWREWMKAIVVAVLLAGGIRYFIFAPIIVDGYSMMPTLHNHERMIVNKLAYKIGMPHRFDIIVFHAEEGRDYIKRVIGLPGDRIEYKNDTLYINGKPYKEPYLDEYKKQLSDGGPLTESFTLEELTGRSTVPPGHLFVMGDNRRFSKDSRHIGFIPMSKVVGKASLVYWPLADARIVK